MSTVWYSFGMEDQKMSVALCVLVVSVGVLVMGFLRRFRSVDSHGCAVPTAVGTMLNLATNISRLHDYHTDISEKYKTFRFVYPTCSYVFTADPNNVEHILKANVGNYVKGKQNQEKMRDLLGDGILAADGEMWKNQRKVASLEVSSKMMRDFSRGVFCDNAGKLANILAEAAEKKETVDMQDLFMRASFDAICKVLFGVDIDSLSATSRVSSSSTPEASCLFMAFDDANAMMFQRYMSSFWKVKKLFNIGSEAIMSKSLKTMDDFLYKIIQSRKKDLASLDKENVKPDLLSRYIAMYENEYEKLSDRFLRDTILNFMVAARDTVAITLSWFLYMVCKHQEVQEKLLKEIAQVTEDSENPEQDHNSFAQNLTFEALEKMHYLHAALSETLRLYPAIPVDGRYVLQDDTLPDKTKVKKGDSVHYLPYAMGRMSYLWGNDAKQFKPERWLDDKGIFRPESPFKFTAFQGGPRICVGKDLAYTQMKIMAAVLVNCFRFEQTNLATEIAYKTMFTLRMEGGLQLQVKSR